MNDRVLAAGPRSWLDSLGAAVSIGCAVQCALFPVLVSVLPFPLLASVMPYLGPGLLLGGSLETFLLVTAVALAVGSFTWGFRFHGRFYVFLFLISAVASIFIGRMWVARHYQVPFIILGSSILATGHFFNYRLCRRCLACCASVRHATPNPAALKRSAVEAAKP